MGNPNSMRRSPKVPSGSLLPRFQATTHLTPIYIIFGILTPVEDLCGEPLTPEISSPGEHRGWWISSWISIQIMGKSKICRFYTPPTCRGQIHSPLARFEFSRLRNHSAVKDERYWIFLLKLLVFYRCTRSLELRVSCQRPLWLRIKISIFGLFFLDFVRSPGFT